MERGSPLPPFAERAAEDCRAPNLQAIFTPRIVHFSNQNVLLSLRALRISLLAKRGCHHSFDVLLLFH
jgi:hypothetical protein